MRDDTSNLADGGVYRGIFEHAPDALFVLDENARVREENRAARALDVDLDALLVGGTDDADLTAFRAELLARGSAIAELRVAAPGRTPRWFAVEGCTQGRVHVVVVRDVTERRNVDEELRHLRRVESLGHMTAAVAHDFNNLLVPIVCSSALLSGEVDVGTTQATLVDEIREAAERAAALVRQMLSFVRREPTPVQRVDVAAVVSRLRPLLRRVVGDGVEVTTELTSCGEIMVDREHLEHVLMNLAANARDAMPRGGRLVVRCADVVLGDGEVCGDETAGAYVAISVTDTGIGMSPEIRERIFERFFTTKEPGHGTGLGLATAHRFVTQSGGCISVHTEQGQGTTVVLRFPVAPAPRPTLAPPRPSTPSPRGAETILLVEDDDRVRAVLRAVLEEEGYRVVDAPSGDAALRVADGARFDLVLTDVVMPGMSGAALVEHLRARGSDAKVLYMSGHTEDTLGAHGVLANEHAVLRKAFSPADLASKVREVLATVSPPASPGASPAP